MRRRRGRVRGFTLLEVSLALVMVAMLALSLYASMSVCMRARRSALAAVKPVRASTIAMELICQDLESVLPPTGILAGPFLGIRQLGSTGDADFIEFFSLGADGDRQAVEGVRRIELGLRTDVDPPVLVRRVTRNLLARTQVDPQEEVLCRNVRSLSLRYFDGMTWLEDWDSSVMGDVLPAAIEVQIEMDDDSSVSAATPTSRILRIIPLACAKPLDSSATGATP